MDNDPMGKSTEGMRESTADPFRSWVFRHRLISGDRNVTKIALRIDCADVKRLLGIGGRRMPAPSMPGRGTFICWECFVPNDAR